MGAEGGGDSSYFPAAAMAASGLALVKIFSYLAFTRGGGGGGKHKRWRPPVVGTMFHQLYHVRRIHGHRTPLSREHTTFRMLVPAGRRQTYTCDPAVVEHILKTNLANYGKGPFNHGNARDLFGDGIFAVDGEKWKQQRKIASYAPREPSPTSAAPSSREMPPSSPASSPPTQASNQSLDFQGLMLRATIVSIFTIAFAQDFNTLDGSGEGSRGIRRHQRVHHATLHQPVLEVGKAPQRRRRGDAQGEDQGRRRVCLKLIRARSDELSKAQDPGSRHDILSRFLQATTSYSGTVDYKYLRDIILNIVIAGKDATAGELAWFLYMVCKHPEVREICHEAMEATNARDTASVDEFLQSLTEQELNNMHYLRTALTETLRLYPSVPMENKQCFSDDVLHNGFNVGEGDIVFFIPYAMGRMESLWGKDAEALRPERWLD